MTVSIDFFGAAGTVTGSCFRVRHAGGAFLVDCGMFQGAKTLRTLNYGDFPFEPHALDFLALTHAHIDHSGLVPKLVRHGFRGAILATEGTRDLLAFLLPDSGAIQEQEVEQLNRRNRRRDRRQVEPIYTAADGAAAVRRIHAVDYDRWQTAGGGVRLRFWNAGHILGSASIEAEVPTHDAERPMLRLLFSGDVGPEHKLFHPDPEGPSAIDALVVESTYGNRDRPEVSVEERRRLLAATITEAMAAGGVLLIPAFAVERTQELLLDLAYLFTAGRVERVPVFLDSPLANAVTAAFAQHAEDLQDIRTRDPFALPDFHFVESVEQSKAINRLTGRAIVIAASGMCDAGRIRHHLVARLWRPDTTLLFVGFQAVGTLGRILLDGADVVRIHGEEVRVKARIRRFDHYSGHADRVGLVRWIEARRPIALATYVVHGEPDARASLAAALAGDASTPTQTFLPALDDTVELPGRPVPRPLSAPRMTPTEAAMEDWHNDYARLLLALKPALERLPDDAARADLLARMRRALD